MDHIGLAVECRGVRKDFGAGASRVSALRGVDLDVEQGRLTMLVGPSGCGKTTLLSIIAGLLDPSEGQVRVLGREAASLSRRERAIFRRRNVGFVFQQYNLLPSLSAAENAAVPLLAAGEARRRAVGRASRTDCRLDPWRRSLDALRSARLLSGQADGVEAGERALTPRRVDEEKIAASQAARPDGGSR